MGYIRVKFGFWALQPVFHVYNLTYLIWPPGIINHDLPEKNKYTNFKNIETIVYSEVSELKINKFIKHAFALKVNFTKMVSALTARKPMERYFFNSRCA